MAAERLGVPVPEVRRLPLFWRETALAVVGAENKAARIRAKRGT